MGAQAVASAGGATRERRRLLAAVPTAVLFCAVASFWGMNSVAMRVAGRTVPPLTVASVRAVVGGVVLVAIARRQGADWPRTRAEWTGIVSIAVMMTGLSTAFLFLAAKNAPAGVNSILTNTMPIFVALMAPFLLNERASRRAILGIAVGMGGTILVASRAVHGEVKGIGIVFGLLGALASAFGSILYKRFPMPRLDRTMAVAVQLLISSVVLGVMAVPDDRSHMTFPWTFTLSFVYLSLFGLAMSFVFFSELLRRATGLQGSAVAYLSTVLGVLFGAVLLHERLSLLTLVGGAVTIVGVAIVQTPSRRTRT